MISLHLNTNALLRSFIKCERFTLQVIVLDYGMKDKNPLENVRFYRKENDEHSIKLQKNQVCIAIYDALPISKTEKRKKTSYHISMSNMQYNFTKGSL